MHFTNADFANDGAEHYVEQRLTNTVSNKSEQQNRHIYAFCFIRRGGADDRVRNFFRQGDAPVAYAVIRAYRLGALYRGESAAYTLGGRTIGLL